MLLKSLFGELTASPLAASRPLDSFAATAILESTDTRIADDGRMLDRHRLDLFVTGSPAQAIHEHLAQTQVGTESRTITMLDPTRIWAPGVIKALSDATGQPVEKLHLRERASLRTLATVERTLVPRRGDASLKIYHADLRDAQGEDLRVALALMAHSQMSAVIVGPLDTEAAEALLLVLHSAVLDPGWRCDTLLFLLSPNDGWLANRLAAMSWPRKLQVETVTESLTGTSAVWNALLSTWDRRRESAVPPAEALAIQARLVARELRALMNSDGVLGCALAEASGGDLLAGESRSADTDLGRAAAALAPVLHAHRQANADMAEAFPVEEIVVTCGAVCHVMRPLHHRPEQFLFVLVERGLANLALLRFQLAEAERNLK